MSGSDGETQNDENPRLPTDYPGDRVVRLLMAIGCAGVFFLCAVATHILAMAGFGVAALAVAVVVLVHDFRKPTTTPSTPSDGP